MAELWALLVSNDLPFLRHALLVGVLASVAFGVIGCYVVARRITYLAGAMAHCALGGIGAAFFLQRIAGWTWFDPLYGAMVAAVLAAMIMGLVTLYAGQREDTVIGALWAVGMAVGLLFLAKTPGYVDPMGYLFGNILLLTPADIWLVAGLDVVIVAVGGGLYTTFLAVCFDEEYARLRGVPARGYYLLLLVLTALTIVLLVRVVGIVMVVALLTLPAAVAGFFARSLWQMMVYAVVLCLLFITSGLGVSYLQDLPSGPVIIVIAGTGYLLTAVCKR